MVAQQKWAEIEELLAEGLSVPQVFYQTGISTTTIYKLIKNGGPLKRRHQVKTSPLIKPFENEIKSNFNKGVDNATKIYQEIKKSGYKGSYATVNNYLVNIIEDKKIKHYKPATRVETSPGEQAQVDWGSFGKIEINGREEHLYAFVYILSYSRALYAEFTIHQDLQTLQECHKNAFDKLGGVPRNILYDNMKTVVIRREEIGDQPRLNPGFSNFAEFYDFHIQLCPPRWPRAKGKVEAAVKYIRHNFFKGMKYKKGFKSLDDINEKLKNWLKTISNQRIHKTTGEMPITRWQIEKPYLKPLNKDRSYETSPSEIRYSTKDNLVQYKHNYYLLPNGFARKKLTVKKENKNGVVYLSIYFKKRRVTRHILSKEKGKIIRIVDSSGHKNKHIMINVRKPEKSKNPEVIVRPSTYYDSL